MSVYRQILRVAEQGTMRVEVSKKSATQPAILIIKTVIGVYRCVCV